MYFISKWQPNCYQSTSSKESSNLLKQKAFKTAKNFYEIAVEAVAFAVAATVVYLFKSPMFAPLLGISIGLFTSKLVVKILDHYNGSFLIKLSKQACTLYKNFPKLQLISFIFALAISTLSDTFGLIFGIALGSFEALVLNIENYKLLQQANRKKVHELKRKILCLY